MRVPHFLSDNGVPFERVLHPPAYSAQRRAHYVGIPGSRVVKAVLLEGPAGLFLAVLPATHHVDTRALALYLGAPVRLATAARIHETFADCEWGVVSAMGCLYGLPTILEDSLPPESKIVFEAHFHGEAMQMRCADYERLVRPRRLRFATPAPGSPTPATRQEAS